MTYELTLLLSMALVATLTAWWMLANGIERRRPAVVKQEWGGLPRHAVKVTGLAVLAIAVVAAGGLVLRRGGHGPLETGARLLAQGRPALAVRVLDNVVAERPDDPQAHYYLGTAYARLGVSKAALRHLKDAVRLAPREAKFHQALGAAYRRKGSLGMARDALETAVRLAPAEPEHRIMLAGALIDDGQIAGAVDHLRRAVTARPQAPGIRLLLATALNLAGDQVGMLRELREVMRIAPDGALSEIAWLEARAVVRRNALRAPRN